PVDMTAGVQVTPSWFTFMDQRKLLVSQIAGGHVQLAEYTIAGNSARQTRLWFTVPGNPGDGRAARAVSLSRYHQPRIAYFYSSFDQPPEVHAGLLAAAPPPAVTSINADLKASWGKAQSVDWNNQGFHVQGWLLYPANYDPHKEYPLIVYVHGGPSSAVLPDWNSSATAYSTFGYFV